MLAPAGSSRRSTSSSDGGDGVGNVVMDRTGNFYGVAGGGGAYGYGVIWEITP